jgi:hypothetical protein
MLGLSVMAKCAVMIASMRSSIQLLWSYLSLLEPPMRAFTDMAHSPNIWLQPGTRAHMLVYKGDHWEVWVATNSRSGDSSTWLGTYMELYPNGKCIQSIRTEAEVREFVIRSSLGDYNEQR